MKTITYDENLWQLMPKEPTADMLDAARRSPVGCYTISNGVCLRVWSAFLAAAPKPPKEW